MIWLAIAWCIAAILAIILTLALLALRAERQKTADLLGELMVAASELLRARGAIRRLQRISERYQERRCSDVN